MPNFFKKADDFSLYRADLYGKSYVIRETKHNNKWLYSLYETFENKAESFIFSNLFDCFKKFFLLLFKTHDRINLLYTNCINEYYSGRKYIWHISIENNSIILSYWKNDTRILPFFDSESEALVQSANYLDSIREKAEPLLL